MNTSYDCIKVVVMLCMVALCRSGAMAYIAVFGGLCTLNYLSACNRKKQRKLGRSIGCYRKKA